MLKECCITDHKTLFFAKCFLLRCDVLWRLMAIGRVLEKPHAFVSSIQKIEETFISKMWVKNHEISQSQVPYWNLIRSHRAENSKSHILAPFLSFRQQATKPGTGAFFLHWASQAPSYWLESQFGSRNPSENS